MQVSARADYALRAMAELAAVADEEEGSGQARPGTLTGVEISGAQEIPRKFLQNILFDLNKAGLAKTQRGAGGGYRLARRPEEISLADIIRAVEGPLANVRGEWPEDISYPGAAEPLAEVWIALRANMRAVLEQVTLADVASGALPEHVLELTRRATAREHH